MAKRIHLNRDKQWRTPPNLEFFLQPILGVHAALAEEFLPAWIDEQLVCFISLRGSIFTDEQLVCFISLRGSIFTACLHFMCLV